MSHFITDLKYACRMLRKNPGFTAIALITLAIGIGANTIMFSLVNVLVLRPMHVQDPGQLVGCKANNAYGDFPYSAFLEMRDHNPVFSDMMACDEGFSIVTLTPRDNAANARRAMAMHVTANYFSFLGVAPAQGRAFLPAEEKHGAEPVVVLSHATWQRQGVDPDVVGTPIAINGTLFRIVGVAPQGFTGTTVIGPDLWLPLGTHSLVKPRKGRPNTAERFNYPSMLPVGRLKAGLTVISAQAQLQSLVPRLKESEAWWWPRPGTLSLNRLPRLSMGSGGNDRAFLSGAGLFLMSVSAVVLLIACLNLANMAIVQGTARHREIAIRLAIGGGRWRIVRQLLVESLLVAVLGGVLGLVLAFWGTRIMNAWVGVAQFPTVLTDSAKMGIDLRALAATLGFCLIATVLSGLKPALQLSRREVVADLKESAGGTLSSIRKARRPGGVSVVFQIAFSVVLVMGAAMFTRSAIKTLRPNADFGFNGKLLIEVDTLAAGYDLARSQQVYGALADRLRSMHEIQAVSLSASFPFAEGGSYGGVVREYVPTVEEDRRDEDALSFRPIPDAPSVYTVGVDYFEAMGMPLMQGRTFQRLDTVPDAEDVIIIDERIAHRLRPNGNAMGCLVEYGRTASPPKRVVGIVPNLRTVSDNDVGPTQIYVPMKTDGRPVFMHLRMASTASVQQATLLQRIRAEIRNVDPHLPVVSVMPLAESHHNNPFVWAAGFGARLAASFGVMALFLASLGIYAVKGHMVASRTPEIGIRKALGATHRDIMGMVFWEGFVLTLVGLTVGLLLGLGVGRLISSMLFGINAIDPLSMIVTILLLGTTSLLAGYFPAQRAARIDPMVALRYE